jgi:uncharacterized LabA/DUF88 family protein
VANRLADRAILFIDGSNWYHGLKENGVHDTLQLDYSLISKKLVGPRDWIGTRYYGVALDQASDAALYADNRRFLSLIEQDDPRISTHLGRVEPRPLANPLADELGDFLDQGGHRLGAQEKGQLRLLVRRYQSLTQYVEKGVDVRLAVDLYRLGQENAYDAAYLLSADGDFVPAVEAVSALGRTVYAACPNYGSALGKACKAFIQMPADWFHDCYR